MIREPRPVEQHAHEVSCHDDGGEHGSGDADEQRQGKSLDDARPDVLAEPVQDGTRDHGRDI